MDTSADRDDIDEDALVELTANFSKAARILFGSESVAETLVEVVKLAEATIEGCDCAGALLIGDLSVAAPGHVDPTVADISALEELHGDGPTREAVARAIMIYVSDLSDDDRWPGFRPQALAAGIRSALVLPLGNGESFGALSLYARYPAAFSAIDRAKAAILASLASLAVTTTHSHEDEDRRADNFQAALMSRELIGQAQGILMERERITAAQAFDILRRASQHFNRKLRDVAQDLVSTGERPETPSTEHETRTSQPSNRRPAHPEPPTSV